MGNVELLTESMLLTEPTCELSLFSFKLSRLVRYFYQLWEAKSIWKKSNPLKQLFDALETNSLTLMTVMKFFSLTFSIANMAGKWKHKGNFRQWFNVFLVISEAWQGYESKAYVVSNHHLKLQPKKFSRTRDIWHFPTQGWADTAFYTSNWNRTYTFGNNMNLLDKSPTIKCETIMRTMLLIRHT